MRFRYNDPWASPIRRSNSGARRRYAALEPLAQRPPIRQPWWREAARDSDARHVEDVNRTAYDKPGPTEPTSHKPIPAANEAPDIPAPYGARGDRLPEGAEPSSHDGERSAATQQDIEPAPKSAPRTRATAAQHIEDARRRLERASQAQVQQQRRAIVRDMLTVYDDLERTLSAAEANVSAMDDSAVVLLQGVKMVRDSFVEKLAQHGAKPVDSDGLPFDPHQHEAIGTEEVAPARAGTIVRTIQRGFTMADQVLRPARVMVGKA